MKPKFFIGSSNEARNIAETLHAILDNDAEVKTWTYGVFGAGKSSLECLIEATSNADFACFILSPDDKIISRSAEKSVARDNVIFEIGLFMGALGRERVFVLHDRNNTPEIPSDLHGIGFVPYNGERSDKDWHSILIPPKTFIISAISRLGRLRTAQPLGEECCQCADGYRVDETLPRGGTNFADVLVDGALYIVEPKYKYKDDLKNKIMTWSIPPMKYLYHSEEGCEYWLKICQSPVYKFYHNSVSHLRSKVSEIVRIVRDETGSSEIDLVDLGCGDGEKDHILLKAFTSDLNKGEKIYFYPVDISDPMIVEAMRTSVGGKSDIDRRKVAVKAILGDITRLKPLQPIFEERSNFNMFSILGNTIGNADELDIIESIKDGMLPGDFVLIEVNVDQASANEKDPFFKEEINMRHDFSPLASLGIKFDKKLMKYKNVTGKSVVPSTITTLAFYEKATINARDFKDIPLSAVHHYQIDSFRNTIEQRLDVTTLFTSTENGVGLILARRGVST